VDTELSQAPIAAPGRASAAFAAALGAGDLRMAADCFSRDACLVTPDGTAVHGRQRIRALLAQLILIGAEIAIESSSILVAGDVALGYERWTIGSRGPEGAPFSQVSSPNLVLRRIEAEWKIAIASPWAL
jgi:ketosteroid isomerase-like protein